MTWEKDYIKCLQNIIDNGETRNDRTGTGTLAVFGDRIRINLKNGFPAVTVKKLPFKSVVSELLWFLEGSTDERRLAKIHHGSRDQANKTIWTANANSESWAPKAEYQGDVGRIYGAQWRSWKSGDITIDQIKNVIDKIKNNPCDRRIIVSAWNPGEFDRMALPPCHAFAQFYVNNQDELSCQMYQRSADQFLGVPFNIASYALLTHMIAQVTGKKVNELIIVFGDSHIYNDHMNQVNLIKDRVPYEPPSLYLNPDITHIDDFTMNDIRLNNYQSWPTVSAPMSV